MERVEQPRSYAVKTEKGTIIRRNRRDLLSTPERFDLRDAVDDEMEILPNPLAVQLPQPNQPTFTPNHPPLLSSRSTSDRSAPKSRQPCVRNNSELGIQTRSGRVVKPPTHL
ncbi:Hypothetical predicted protein [Paramuricea clavata]|uniref:Uncharacterized protein n=1 Tax=Paramuricea clavata TaxID=317549 RepID=A0A6S7IA20_PARCT|nr:Hypothetical predicted protein [Paramuricea clavata]